MEKERNKLDAHLHRAIIDKDTAKVYALVQQKPSLTHTVILAVMAVYADMRSHHLGKKATPLIAAIHANELDICKCLIEEGADVNLGYLSGMGPLCLALSHKHYKIAELLIESGANILATDCSGRAAMIFAIGEHSPVSIVKTMLSAGCPKNGEFFYNGILKCTPLVRAICMKNVSVVKFLMEQNVDVNTLVKGGTTPLNFAVGQQSPEIVKLLIDHGANVEGHFMNDPPPLFFAVQTEDTPTLKVLINAGVDINRLFTPLQYGNNTLFMPCVFPLELAALHTNLPITKMLLEHGANINALNPSSDASVIHLVSAIDSGNLDKSKKSNHRRIIQYLLENGADTNVTDGIQGELPIEIALSSKNWIAVEEHIIFGVNFNKLASSKYGSILQNVIRNKVDHLVDLCLAYGADCFQKCRGDPIYKDVLRSNCPNYLRLFWKYSYPLDDVPSPKSLKNSPKVFSLLNTQQRFLNSIKVNDPKSVKNTLKRGAEVNCQSKTLLDYPLHFCSARGDTEIVKILLENRATISILNSSGYSALHLAARGGHIDVCKLLLRYGACFDSRGPGGATPRQLARSAGHTKLVHFFNSVSRCFSALKNKNVKSLNDISPKLSSEEFLIFINCVNHRGNTLLREALRLNLISVSEDLMALRLKAV